MATDTKKLGVYYVPGTFPTDIVVEYLNHITNWDWSRDAVNSLYFHYKSGVESGDIEWWDYDKIKHMDTDPVLEYMTKKSAIAEKDIFNFLFMIDYLVEIQKIHPIYLEITRPESDPLTKAETAAKETAKKSLEFVDKIKWIAIAGIVLAVGIYAGPVIYKATKKKGKK